MSWLEKTIEVQMLQRILVRAEATAAQIRMEMADWKMEPLHTRSLLEKADAFAAEIREAIVVAKAEAKNEADAVVKQIREAFVVSNAEVKTGTAAGVKQQKRKTPFRHHLLGLPGQAPVEGSRAKRVGAAQKRKFSEE